MKGIRANLMLKRDCDDQLRQRLRFVDAGTRARTTQCLELITYEVQGPQPDIVLPISNDLNTALPGAPIAFLDRSAAIDDTWQIAFAPGVPEQVRTEVNTYFRQSAFRSFGSIQMPGRAGAVGVINVEARVTQVFGQTADERRQLIRYLLPFFVALANVYSNPLDEACNGYPEQGVCEPGGGVTG
jgi:hypothetical protein